MIEKNGIVSINLKPDDGNLKHMFNVMVEFITSAWKEGKAEFSDLYRMLVTDEKHIGIRKGLIPIYLSAVFHEYSREIVINDRAGQVPVSLDTVLQINAEPELFTLSYLSWDEGKADYIRSLEDLFSKYVLDSEKGINPYSYIFSAMKRWYLGLPKYAKNLKSMPDGSPLEKEMLNFIQELRNRNGSYEFLFKRLPAIYEEDSWLGVLSKVAKAKQMYDSAMVGLKGYIATEVKRVYASTSKKGKLEKMSVTSVVKDWCESLNPAVFSQLFPDGTDRCLRLFREADNDEDGFIINIGKVVTDLRLEDWDRDTIRYFMKKLPEYKKTAEEFQTEEASGDNVYDIKSYHLSYVDEDGTAITKRFEKVEESRLGKLLHSAIVSQIESMGQAVSDQEKRQILMDVLKDLC